MVYKMCIALLNQNTYLIFHIDYSNTKILPRDKNLNLALRNLGFTKNYLAS